MPRIPSAIPSASCRGRASSRAGRGRLATVAEGRRAGEPVARDRIAARGAVIAILLGITLAAQAILFAFTAISFCVPERRVWPPPSRSSWQLRATWLLSWVSLSGVFLLALLAGNTLGLPGWLRLGLGAPLLVLGASLVGWGFRALSVSTSLGVAGDFVGSGPYRFSRNPQYLGGCLYLAALVLLSGSHLAAIGGLAVALWFVATPFVEEPWLAERFGAAYDAYRREVPRFLGLRRLLAHGR